MSVRIAENHDEIDAAQALRYQVFSSECGAKFDVKCTRDQRDRDAFDPLCDHLIVVDKTLGSEHEEIVGTYRFMASKTDGQENCFYSQGEYDVNALVARHPRRRFMELGRSCVLPEYRGRRTIELLWQGIWAYCRARDIDVMFGCASFVGAVPAYHALPLSFLHHFARSDEEWVVSAHDRICVDMDMMPAEAVSMRNALDAMPPLIKGYLRLGAQFGRGAVIDREFGTTDVLVVLPLERINSRYIQHYGENATRFSA